MLAYKPGLLGIPTYKPMMLACLFVVAGGYKLFNLMLAVNFLKSA